ncbi:acetamidase/formamidase family protein [Mycolicibacterium sp. Dal123E01]|uniref:acetamidase/formamidase family protein n=1 Tax=Mycolicibacterium sp. Dal123E01 TaxID=3457578 RepID=UPI00403EEDE1
MSPIREIRPVQPYPYAMGKYYEPLAVVAPGEVVDVYTEDAFEGRITSTDDKPTQVLGKYVNPQTGPIIVEGAEVGDTLIAHIEDIELTRDFAVSLLIPGFGGLTSSRLAPSLQEPLPEKVWIYQRQPDGRFAYDPEIFSITAKPFMGTIGTAPDLEMLSALTPFDHGGNMDVPDVCAGNAVHLPVRVPGAMFFTGDCHAAQGEGEACGVALEISGRLRVRFELVKNAPIEWPRIVSPQEIMVAGSARPMENAAKIAYSELVYWLENEYGFDRWDAYQLVTQAGKLYVGNMVDTYYTVVAKLDRQYLPPAAG